MNYFKRILRFAKPYKRYAWLNAFSNVFYALFSTLSFVAFIPMLNILFKQDNPVDTKPIYDAAEGLSGYKDYLEQSLNFFLNQQIENNGHAAALGYICLAIIILFFLKNIANYAALFFITFLRNGVIKDIRNAMYDKLVTLPISYFTEKRKGDVIARMTSDVQEVEWSFLMVLELIIRDPLTIIFTLAVMLGISVKLTLFMFVFLPLMGLIIAFIGKKLRADSEIVQKENGFFLSLIEESLTGLRVIKGFTAEKQFTNKFQNSTNKLFRTMNSLMNKKNLASPTSEFLGISVIVGILWYGGSMVLGDNSEMSGGAFIGFMALAYNILTPAKSISNAIYGIKKGDASAKRVLEVLETENPITDAVNAKTKTTFDKEIVFDNISFKYQDEYVLKDFSLTIPKGKTVALVGQSGSGKSTLANLITRFYDVNQGAIYIDGVNIKDISKDSLRKLMGIVTQESILFNDTIANNIALGTENTSEEAIIEASKIANAHEFVKDLANQYDANIGDSGSKLSGGQKQRLSIARAVLKNPPIMVLDEATSALDTESEQLVQVALEKMMQNRTSLVIAHRLSTIQSADTIVVLRKGKIIEQGDHEELLKNKADYYKLVTMQNLD